MQFREKSGQSLTEPVTAAELKIYIGYNNTDQDSLFADLITSARQWVENYTSLSAISKIYEVFFESGDDINGWFALPIGPVTSITSVQQDGTIVTYEEKGQSEYSISPYLALDWRGLDVVYVAGVSDKIKILKDAIYDIATATWANKGKGMVITGDVRKKLSTIAISAI